MWILPKQLHTSAFVPDSEGLSLDSNESSQVCAQSLFVRSKHSPARTWLQKWKRDSWTQHLSGRILKPSHGQSFVERWTSSLEDIHANHSVPPGSEPERTTQDISGLGSQTEFDFCDQGCVSLKTSKDTSRWDSPQSSAIWRKWVTEQRLEYSVRVKSARLTSASGCSSWPTPQASEGEKITGLETQDSLTKRMRFGQADQANWPTPQANEIENPNKEYRSPTNAYRDGKKVQPMLADVCKHGQADQANHSTDGSRQESWPTARSMDGLINESLESWTARRDRKQAEGINLHRPLPIAVMQEQKQWATPRSCSAMAATITEESANDPKRFPNLESQVGKAWATPTARDHKSGRGNEERDYKELTPMVERTQSGKLNPRWVCTLMNLPVFWVKP